MPAHAPIWLAIALAFLVSLPSANVLAEMASRKSTTPIEAPAFERSLEAAKARHDTQFATPPDVPQPTDAGGGYTHEQHKKNAFALYETGMLFKWTGDTVYLDHARDLLLAYAELYPTLKEHPEKKEQSPGRLFWQSLNEAVFLVYAAQGYEAIRDALDDAARNTIETKLFRRMVSFLSEQSPQTFDKIHNHGTWAVAATGMTGYVLNDETMVSRALLGLAEDGEAGFLRQLDELFSPDGYYNEGPYYQRYALMPFVLFARAIDQNDPERGIFEYRDGIILKAIRTAVQLSYGGYFFPINDAIKDKGLDTVELDYAIPIAFAKTGDASLLSLIDDDKDRMLSADSRAYAAAQARGVAVPFEFTSLQLRDGARGDRGMLNILREGDDRSGRALVFKATAQGMGHGHFDRLNWIYYDDGDEVVTDYGAARFLNIVQKNGGHYLRENISWARQTVAHNTLVVDETSHFDGNVETSERSSTDRHFFAVDDTLEIASAREPGAYPGVEFTRTMITVDEDVAGYPLIIDVLDVASDKPRQLDLPLYYRGHLVDTRASVTANVTALAPMGSANGYQHLWNLGEYSVRAGTTDAVTWLNKRRFYSQSVLASQDATVHLTRVGAGDPDFSLRPESGMLRRFASAKSQTKDLLTVSVLVTHGEYNGSREYTRAGSNPVSSLTRHNDAGRDVIRINFEDGRSTCIALSYDSAADRTHSMTTVNGTIVWNGFAQLVECEGAVAAQ